MDRSRREHLNTPIIQDVISLNNILIGINTKAFKVIGRNYLDSILKQGALLFNYAMRQLRGLDYYKRAVELTCEIQYSIYFISSIGGCNIQKASEVDVICDKILSALSKIKSVRNEKS